MSPWYKFYQNRLNSSYLQHVASKYGPFIDEIKKAISKCDYYTPLMEAGCGMANITRILHEDDLAAIGHTYVYDICPHMLGLAVQNTAHLPDIMYYIDDITSIQNRPIGVCYSHGVLEHFSDIDIVKIINLQKRNSAYILHYVPSSRYETPSFGDERLLTPDQWHDICQPDEIIEFNDGYDLILKWN